MKRRSMIIFLLVFQWSLTVLAQQGHVRTESFTSTILKREMGYSVYLPASYGTSNRAYPVLYLLHGMGGNHTDWVNRGEVEYIASESAKAGKSPEMIIIMPDGLIDAFYINNYDKSIRWEDYFYEELIPTVEKKYRIVANRTYRAIAGLSMGGQGSMYHALKHRELFSSCYAMSGAFLEITPLKEGQKPEFFENVYVKLWGPRQKDGIHAQFRAQSVHEMVKALPEFTPQAPWPALGSPSLPRITIDCGDDDFLLRNNTSLVHLLKEKKVPFEFRVREGAHTWEYWRTGLALALEFVGDGFRNY